MAKVNCKVDFGKPYKLESFPKVVDAPPPPVTEAVSGQISLAGIEDEDVPVISTGRGIGALIAGIPQNRIAIIPGVASMQPDVSSFTGQSAASLAMGPAPLYPQNLSNSTQIAVASGVDLTSGLNITAKPPGGGSSGGGSGGGFGGGTLGGGGFNY